MTFTSTLSFLCYDGVMYFDFAQSLSGKKEQNHYSHWNFCGSGETIIVFFSFVAVDDIFYDGGVDCQKWWLLVCNQYYQVQSVLSPPFLFTTWTFSLSLNPVHLLRRKVNANQMTFIERACLPMQETQEDVGFISGSGRFPGGGNGNPFQYSCLENPMDREALRATVHGVTKSQTGQKQLSTQSTFNKQFFECLVLLKIVTSKIAHIFVSEGQYLTYCPLHALVKCCYIRSCL